MTRRTSPTSWGLYPSIQQRNLPLHQVADPLPTLAEPVLAFGNGRSYGDVCLNEDGDVLLTRGLDRFIAFDPATGILRAEAGVLLSEILALVVPQGWFLAVTPGTQFVTLGGAIANDVHGKNHHVAGSFAEHVRAFELLRSDGTRLCCGPEQNETWFRATVGGLGLTGLITWVEIQLQRIANPWIVAENRRFSNLDEFFALNDDYEARYPYTVSWIDCATAGRTLGRGIYMAGTHAPPGALIPAASPRRSLTIPLTPPISLVNTLSVRGFNWLYYHLPRPTRALTPYPAFFYPLDHLLEWNRLYGRRGFFQYQCVIPPASAHEALREILSRIAASGQGSMLAVLKRFGTRTSGGLLSFPRPGVTLALDFPNLGQKTRALLDRLDEVIRQADGAVYPAKDARMHGDSFRHYFPQWSQFTHFIDPHFSSSFWRRVMAE
ncbi:MAG: FAD-binding oxidoreductase [Phycisphaerales bacterium]|nr:FAD-binding oxidoreductase [Phycisphaerales bacterium]